MSEIKAGDVVRLKSGSPQMTVEKVSDYGMPPVSEIKAVCIWFDGAKRIQDKFGIETLDLDND